MYNKIDKIPAGIEAGGAGVPVSALTGENLDRLGAEVAAFFSSLFSVQKFHFSFANFGEASRLRELGRVLEERFTETGVEITAEVDKATAGLMRAFRVE